MQDHIAIAREYLAIHKGDPHQALWHARRLECMPEPLPREIIDRQAGAVAWVAATCDLAGVHLLASGGEVRLAKWAEILAETPQPKDQE